MGEAVQDEDLDFTEEGVQPVAGERVVHQDDLGAVLRVQACAAKGCHHLVIDRLDLRVRAGVDAQGQGGLVVCSERARERRHDLPPPAARIVPGRRRQEVHLAASVDDLPFPR